MSRRPRYQRPTSLILYWDGERLVAYNYASGSRFVVNPEFVSFLHDLERRSPPAGLAAKLARHGLLEPKTRTRDTHPGWREWRPLAEAFHFGTKDIEWSKDPARGERRLAARARHTPMPPPVNRAPRGAPAATLPPVDPDGEFAAALLGRRTWRDFGRAKVRIQDIATLLRLTWGVQQWGIVPGQGRVALKTSPSGGACHPGEVYLLARRVDGLDAGVYRYESDRHRLVRIRRGATRSDVARYLPGQPWYRPAAALFLMTAVFAREQWRYSTPRAYRTVIADAGHLCQTFLLTASWLGLAPFCSMALADSAIERDLGLDGKSEGIIYAAGVGTRPRAGWRPGVPGLRRE